MNLSHHCIVQTPIYMGYEVYMHVKLNCLPSSSKSCVIWFSGTMDGKDPKSIAMQVAASLAQRYFIVLMISNIHLHKHHPFIPKSINLHITVMPQVS